MHVLQWIAVEAEDEGIDPEEQLQETFDGLRLTLDNELEHGGSWYDWFVMGGGRWNVETDNNDILSGYDDKTNMVLHDTEAIKERVAKCIEQRIQEFKDYRKSYETSQVDLNAILDSYDGTMQYHFDLYPLNKMIEMVQGNWDFNAYYYDFTNYSTNPKWLLESLDKGNKNWYLIPVDFHF